MQIFFRNVLDFDFEKLCSVSISRINVYACLVCGKYFQGESIFFFLSKKENIELKQCMFEIYTIINFVEK